jgi:predicted alpha/beta superfamily hydrolase
MRVLFFVTSVAMAVLLSATSFAHTLDAAARTSTHQMESERLGEQRTILVRVPPGFDEDQEYPVVFLTDAEWNFDLVAAYLDYMADNAVFPRLIVTGVVNVNRNRDFVPREDKHFDDTGSADRFLEFVRDEWVPYVSDRYRASDDRVLLGHSFGGVFALHTFFTAADLFDAYIALGASAWIADRVLFEEADAWFDSPENADAFVYMAVGEGDGGPTVPSSRELAELFEKHAPDSLEWTFDITPRADHFKNVVSGMHDAFMALFPAWKFDAELKLIAESEGAAGVDRWFTEKETKLGYRFAPAWFDLGVAAMVMARSGHEEAAQAITRRLREHHPDNAWVAAYSAWVWESSDRPADAALEFERVIEIAERNGLHPNEIHLDRIRRGLERVSVVEK